MADRARLFAFRHFRTRLLAVIVTLVLVLQAIVFFTATEAAHRSALRASEDALQVTQASLKDTMAVREQNLLKYARLLSHDFPFKSLVSETDHDTLISAFGSYRKRLRADWMFVLELDGSVLADTLQPAVTKVPFKQQALLDAVRVAWPPEKSSIQIVGGKAYQVVVVPLRGPLPMAWVGIGFEVTNALAGELETQTHSRVNLAWRTDAASPVLFASTLDAAQQRDLLATTPGRTVRADAHVMRLDGHDFVTTETALTSTHEGVLVATVQRSLDDALASYRALRWTLLAVFVLSTVLAAVAARLIARHVTRPVQRLAEGAQRISAGHYDIIGDIGARDELGALAGSFDDMVRGLIERDKVRAMLGKVVSPAIAEELLSQRINVDGQEQEVSVLFSDIRGFTTLCEGRSPSAILGMLNTYLGTVSDLVDARGGVVDKYIGDAVMALFGAPLVAGDDPQRAVETALAMVRSLPALNAQFALDGWPPLAIGIGIHTGVVVAGNVGSATRLNYTVLGDTVNLASRLEGLCKAYGVAVVVSDAVRARSTGVMFRELDLVRVVGKQEPVAIFQAVGMATDADAAHTQAALAAHARALGAYRARTFAQAREAFAGLAQDAVTRLYIARCEQHLQAAPALAWDGVEAMTEK